MEKSRKRNQKIKSIAIISIVGIVAGFVFTVRTFGFDSARAIKGIVAGFIITFVIGILENFFFQKEFRRLKFSTGLIIRTIVYVIVITFAVILVWVVHESSINGTDIFTTMGNNDFKHFILEGDFKNILLFAIIFSFLINLFTQINNLLGKRVLLNYVTGKYHSPKEEERVFMFVDLTSSTTIAEQLGPVVYHRFINSCFFDIDEAIVESEGEVYQYVGDEVVISWKDKKGFRNANCINCFFNITEKINELSKDYEREFGIVPGFKAGLHWGPVITGEVGDSKKEIAFHGDVLNTAARIQNECNSLQKIFLISEDVLKKLDLPEHFEQEYMGEFTLRGKIQSIKLYSIQKK